MNRFTAIAKKETTLSEVMTNRVKISMDEIIDRFPDGVTVTEFDFVNTTDKKGNPVMFPVCAISEDDTVCFFGGAVLFKICKAWVDDNNGDIDTTSNMLKSAGGVKMKFRKSMTRNGNNLTAVDIL